MLELIESKIKDVAEMVENENLFISAYNGLDYYEINENKINLWDKKGINLSLLICAYEGFSRYHRNHLEALRLEAERFFRADNNIDVDVELNDDQLNEFWNYESDYIGGSDCVYLDFSIYIEDREIVVLNLSYSIDGSYRVHTLGELVLTFEQFKRIKLSTIKWFFYRQIEKR